MPEQHLVFLSHAAIGEEIAKCMKELIERTFPQVEVFASSDPEDLRPSDPWIEKILQKLKKARMMLVLATERGLSRRWVWFETGAGWSHDVPILPCCLGKVRKGQLPAPFFLYQAINVDEGADIEKLFGELTNQSGPPSQVPDYPSIASELVRLDVRAEERELLRKTSGPSAETRTVVEEGLGKLNDAEKEAIRLLLIEGEMTDRRAIQVLKEKGALTDNPMYIFPRIASETGFVRRVSSAHPRERLLGYDGSWAVNPSLKPVLETYLFPR